MHRRKRDVPLVDGLGRPLKTPFWGLLHRPPEVRTGIQFLMCSVLRQGSKFQVSHLLVLRMWISKSTPVELEFLQVCQCLVLFWETFFGTHSWDVCTYLQNVDPSSLLVWNFKLSTWIKCGLGLCSWILFGDYRKTGQGSCPGALCLCYISTLFYFILWIAENNMCIKLFFNHDEWQVIFVCVGCC